MTECSANIYTAKIAGSQTFINLKSSVMERNEGTMLGHVVLNHIPGAECIMHPTKHVKCIIIPVEDNPGITVWEPENDKSRRQVRLWMKIIRKKETDRNGHTHFTKVHVSKNAVEKYRMSQEEERRAGVIIGNFKTFEYNSTTAERIVNAPVTDFTQNDFPPDIDYPSMDNRF